VQPIDELPVADRLAGVELQRPRVNPRDRADALALEARVDLAAELDPVVAQHAGEQHGRRERDGQTAEPEPAWYADDDAAEALTPACPPRPSRHVSDGDDPVCAGVERQLGRQPLDERGPVAVEEGDEPEGPLLRLTPGVGLRLHVPELPPQRLVAALRRLYDLAAQRLQVVLHLSQRRARRALER